MEIIQTIFYFLVAISVLVTFHEFGHFWVARCCGVKVLRFSVGFGTPLFSWKDKQGTEYVVALLPFGGYVKMVDEREEEVDEADLPFSFNRQPVWQRMAIVVAGPLANFILAILAYWVVFIIGVSGVAPIIDSVEKGSVAESVQLLPGNEILSVDGEETPTWQALSETLVSRIGETGEICFELKHPESSSIELRCGQLNGWMVDAVNPDVLSDFGLTLYRPKLLPRAGEITPGDPADQAGIKSADLIVQADGQDIGLWMEWVDYVRARPDQRIELLVERDGEIIETTIVPSRIVDDANQPFGRVGMGVVMPEWPESMRREQKFGPAGALLRATEQTWKTSAMVLDSVGKILSGRISAKHLSGPITIAKVAGASAQYGLGPFLGLMALLSISLGVLNLLPIPVLDGGHLMYFVVEAIKGKPVSEKAQMFGYKIGLAMVVGLMVLALYNDLMRL